MTMNDSTIRFTQTRQEVPMRRQKWLGYAGGASSAAENVASCESAALESETPKN